MRVTATNRGPEAATLHLLPHLWSRNVWSWNGRTDKPLLARKADGSVRATRPTLAADAARHRRRARVAVLRERDQRAAHLRQPTRRDRSRTASTTMSCTASATPSRAEQRHQARRAFPLEIPAGGSVDPAPALPPGGERRRPPSPISTRSSPAHRRDEADEFYAVLQRDIAGCGCAAACSARRSPACCGRSSSTISTSRSGSTATRRSRRRRRAASTGATPTGGTLNNFDILSMPDAWEYPWYASWDLAFHCVTFALIDPDFAKDQLLLLTREWYMHPNGQLPAYEWAFGDVNPPVHAWAAWRVYQMDRALTGKPDRGFLVRVFHKLMLNFTWWVNRKDAEGRNIFQGGFLGLDNIGIFDRSRPLPTGGTINQSDGTAWMAMYALNLMRIALELAQRRPRLRGHREQVLRAFPLHRRGDDQHGRRRRRAVGRAGPVLLRRAQPARRPHRDAARALDGGADPALRGRGAGSAGRRRNSRASPAGCAGSSAIARSSRRSSRAGTSPASASARCSRCCAGIA